MRACFCLFVVLMYAHVRQNSLEFKSNLCVQIYHVLLKDILTLTSYIIRLSLTPNGCASCKIIIYSREIWTNPYQNTGIRCASTYKLSNVRTTAKGSPFTYCNFDMTVAFRRFLSTVTHNKKACAPFLFTQSDDELNCANKVEKIATMSREMGCHLGSYLSHLAPGSL